jgi:hypothetical protein
MTDFAVFLRILLRFWAKIGVRPKKGKKFTNSFKNLS